MPQREAKGPTELEAEKQVKAKEYIAQLESEIKTNAEMIETFKDSVTQYRKENRRKRTLIQNIAKEHGIHTGE